MALTVSKGKTTKQPLATALRSHEAFTRRPIIAGVLLTAVVLTIIAVKSLSSGAVTVPTVPTVSTPPVSTPARIHVPAGDRLVLVDTVLASSSRPAGGTAVSRPATASRARVSAIRHGRAKLSFTLQAGKNNAKISVVTVRLPSGIAFSQSHTQLEAGIVVKTGAKRLKLTAERRRGPLTIRLKTPASRVHVRIASPAIAVSKALAHKVKTRDIKTLYTSVTATDTNEYTTRLILKQRTR